jgi:putative FmdB family regulatory protein
MPIYEFICSDCGSRFEKILSSWQESTDCSRCHSAKVEKQFSSFAVGSVGAAGQSGGSAQAQEDCGPCGCGAPRPGMCSMN